MSVNVTGRQLVITPAIQSYTEKLFAPFSELAMLKTTSVNVTMEMVKNKFDVCAVVNCKSHTLKAETTDFDLYKALDAAAAKLDGQVAELKGRVQEHHAVPLCESESAKVQE